MLPLVFCSTAWAAGTPAGTDITNVASASFDVGGVETTIQSNTVVIKVDELLDVTVAAPTGDLLTSPGFVGNVQRYQVTNTGNGSEAFSLTANVANTGDDFDPVLQKIVIDTNGNGVYDPGVDEDYTVGGNDPVLAPDTSRYVFILSTTPASALDTNRAEVSLTATAVTGTGAPGTSFAGAGQGGGNAVVGSTSALASASAFLAVQASSVSILKSASILDPFGGNRPVPGAIVTYSLVATVSGSGSLNNLVITDPIPAGSQYQANTITLEAAALTDATDTDAADYNGTRVRVAVGNVPAGQIRTVTFKVRIP
jgi:uncharacterized repeat protein (TIGR01451 family)